MNKRIYLLVFFMLIGGFTIQSCGPIVLLSRPEQPLPPWFYPNRVEAVRYVYFPEHTIYYDLYLRNYLYLNNNIWVRVNVLPERYSAINLNRSRYVRVTGYRGDTIRQYHNENNVSRSTRSTRATTTRTNTRRN